MSYTKTNWQNSPSTNTPLSAANLNHMEQGIYDATDTADSAAAGVAALQGLNYAPIPVTLAADMTDQTKIYVYLGSEAGYQSGHWYYWNGAAWTEGGGYNSLALVTDKTLSIADDAADAKATGDAVSALNSALNCENGIIKLESGAFDSTYHKIKVDNVKRIRNVTPIPLNEYFKVLLPSGYTMYVFWFDEDMNYLNATSGQTGFGAGNRYAGSYYANIQIMKTGSEDADISSYVQTVENGLTVTIQSDTDKHLYEENRPSDGKATGEVKKNVEFVVEALNQTGVKNVVPVWESGTIDVDGTDAPSVSRVRCDFIDVRNAEKINLLLYGYFRVYVFGYGVDQTTVLSRNGWYSNSGEPYEYISQDIDVYNVAYIRIVFGRPNDVFTPYATVQNAQNMIKLAVITSVLRRSPNIAFHGLFLPANSERYIFAKGKMWEALWNTEESYTLAGQDARCWCIDGDVQYTKDDVLVMYHDTTVPFGNLGNNYAIADLTYAQIQTIVLTQGGVDYSIPTFDEFIQICRTYGKVCCVELKGRTSPWAWSSNGKSSLLDEMVQKLYDLGMQDSCFFMAPSADLQYIRNKYHSIPCCRLWDSAVTAANIASYINDPDVLPGGYAADWVSNDTMKTAHAAGQKTIVYSTRPQTAAMITAMKAVNADAICVFIDPDAE